jgi:multiple sugar transport system ATP-binding protein
MASVTFKKVTKYYQGSVPAVKDVSLDIADGEFFVIVGPSGCGKTTLLRMLAGLEEVSGGDVYINEKRVNGVPPGLRNVSMVFQNYALFPHMSVHDNMAFGLKVRGTPKNHIEHKVKQASSLLGLESYLNKKPKELSGGQRQRVALGRALVRDPDIFLFDEPLSNLDAKLRGEMRVELLKLHKELGSTVMYVTHDQVEAMTLGHRICVLNQGLVLQVDSPQNIYNYPENTFVASFFGSPPMNLFTGLLKESGNEYSVVLEGGVVISLAKGDHDPAGLKEYAGREVFAGIRPGSFSAKEKSDARNVMNVNIEAVELIGEEKYIHGQGPNGKRITVSLPAGSRAAAGEELSLGIDAENLHLFDSSGNRL